MTSVVFPCFNEEARILPTLDRAIGFLEGRGEGWEFRHRPDGGELVCTRFPGKVQALSAVRKAARVHAKALGLPLHRPEEAK